MCLCWINIYESDIANIQQVQSWRKITTPPPRQKKVPLEGKIDKIYEAPEPDNKVIKARGKKPQPG